MIEKAGFALVGLGILLFAAVLVGGLGPEPEIVEVLVVATPTVGPTPTPQVVEVVREVEVLVEVEVPVVTEVTPQSCLQALGYMATLLQRIATDILPLIPQALLAGMSMDADTADEIVATMDAYNVWFADQRPHMEAVVVDCRSKAK